MLAEQSKSKIADMLKEKREEILRLAEKHGAMNVRVFGSVVRGEDNDDIENHVPLLKSQIAAILNEMDT